VDEHSKGDDSDKEPDETIHAGRLMERWIVIEEFH